MKKLVFIHTTPIIISKLNTKLKKRIHDISIENIMDDSLSKLLKQDRNKALERLNTIIKLAVGDDKSEDVEIVTTCTALSALVGETSREIIMIDSYLHKELAKYNCILLLATTKGALLPTKTGILNNAQKTKPQIDEIFVENAREEAKNGNINIHDNLIKEEILEVFNTNDKNYDAIVLCQPSMAHLKTEIEKLTDIKVFTGVDLFIENYS